MENQTRKRELPPAETALFCHQAAMILKSGIALYDGIEVMYRSYEDSEHGPAFRTICEGVRSGGSLYEGVKAAGFFPDYMVNMVRVGETVGKLDDVLESLGEYYDKEDKLRSAVRSAVVYPLVLVAMMAAVVSILVVKVLPVFSEVFRSLGTGLTASSAAVLSGGVMIGRGVLALTAVLLLAALGICLAWKLGGREKVLAFANRLFPPVRRLARKQAAKRFAEVVSMVMESGYSLENALDMLPELLPDGRNIENARRCKAVMEEGGNFAAAAEQAELFEPLHLKMIQVGVEAGQTGQVLERMSEIYGEEVEAGVQNLASWIEPALVGVLTMAIGGILLSVMLPLASIMASIG